MAVLTFRAVLLLITAITLIPIFIAFEIVQWILILPSFILIKVAGLFEWVNIVISDGIRNEEQELREKIKEFE